MQNTLFFSSLLLLLMVACDGPDTRAPILNADGCLEIDFSDIQRSRDHRNNIVPKLIWTFWDTGEANMPAFHRFNINNLRKKLEPQGYKIIVANTVKTDPNYVVRLLGGRELLPEFFDRMAERVRPYEGPKGPVKMHPGIVQSDFARIALLEKFGGIWFDGTNVLVTDFNEILKGFEESEQTVAGYVMERYASTNSVKVNDKPVDGLENWLIVAKPDSALIKAWRRALTVYWQTRKVDQLAHEHPMYCNNFDFGGLGISAANYLNQHAALKYVLFHERTFGNEIFPLDFNPWWFSERLPWNDADGGVYNVVVGPKKFELASEAMKDKVALLKFPNDQIYIVNQFFNAAENFCVRDNFFAKLYSLSMSSKSWCETR